MAVEITQAADVKKMAFTHHNLHHEDSFLEDLERQAQASFTATVMAREGMILEL